MLFDSAAMAQSVERILGKDEVGGSNPPSSSITVSFFTKLTVFFYFLTFDVNRQGIKISR